MFTQNSKEKNQLIISTLPRETANKKNEALHRDLLGGNNREDLDLTLNPAYSNCSQWESHQPGQNTKDCREDFLENVTLSFSRLTKIRSYICQQH